MPFIGKQPEVGAYQLIDSITTSATATYALTVDGSAYFPASARNLIVSLNGVTQAPESAYTVSGSDIVFASALTASDVIDYILVVGDAVDIGTPSDGTVGTSQMSYPLGDFSSTGIDDNATGERLEVNDGNVIIKANSGSNSHAFGYNEDGGEIILYDEAGAAATLIDQAVNNTRVLELINGSDLLIGLGGSNSTGAIKFMGPAYSVKARIDGDGLKFNTDTAAVNALDDYEEGIWTPTVNSNTTSSTTSYTLQKGYYTKIGNRVCFNLYMNFDVTTAGTGFFYVTLPFTVAAGHTYSAAAIAYQNVYTVAAGYHLNCYTEQNANRIYFAQNNSLQGPPVSGARTLMISGHYQA